DLILPQMALGFKGVISVAGNCFPTTFSEMVRLAANGNFDDARKLHYKMLESIHLLFVEGNPTGIKAILAQKEISGNHLRLPLIPASDTLFEKLAAFKDIQ